MHFENTERCVECGLKVTEVIWGRKHGDSDQGGGGEMCQTRILGLEPGARLCELRMRTWRSSSPSVPPAPFRSTPRPPSARAAVGCAASSALTAPTRENKDIAHAVNPGSDLFVISTHLKCTCYPKGL